VNADVNNAGTVTPGPAIGTLTITRSFTQTSTGTLNIRIGGPSQFDTLAVGGTATLGGTLNVSLTNGFAPSNGNAFQVISYASRSGAFATMNGLEPGNGLTFYPEYNLTNFTLRASATSVPVLSVHVTWQGIPQPNSRNTTETITMTLRLAGGGPANEFTGMTTDAGGYFTVPVSSLPSGTYNIRVKGPRNLSGPTDSCATTVTLSGAPVTSVDMGLQKAGDALSTGPSNFNIVNAADFTTLKATFGKSYGQFGYDSRADFDNTDVVTAADFTLLKGNFGQAGCGSVLEPAR
jgi:hypothetical protein